VPKIGPKAFEQCAGFLRVPGGKNILDNTGVHPESYAAAEKLLTFCGCSLVDVSAGGAESLRSRVSLAGEEKASAYAGVGVPTLRDIVDDLMKPGRDPRDELPAPSLRTDVMAWMTSNPACSCAVRCETSWIWGICRHRRASGRPCACL
jgi:uncharacterized protein